MARAMPAMMNLRIGVLSFVGRRRRYWRHANKDTSGERSLRAQATLRGTAVLRRTFPRKPNGGVGRFEGAFVEDMPLRERHVAMCPRSPQT